MDFIIRQIINNIVHKQMFVLLQLQTHILVSPLHFLHILYTWDTRMCLGWSQTCNNRPYTDKQCFSLFYMMIPPFHSLMLWKILKENKKELTMQTITTCQEVKLSQTKGKFTFAARATFAVVSIVNLIVVLFFRTGRAVTPVTWSTTLFNKLKTWEK